MVLIPIQVPTRTAGLDFQTTSVIWTTAVGPDTFAASPNNFLFVRSTNAGTVTVTVTPSAGTGPLQTTITPLALAPVVAANGFRVYGPFPTVPFADASDGLIHINYTTVSGGALFVYCAAVNMGAV